MKLVDQYITPELLGWIRTKLGETKDEKTFVPKVYKGYISSMGASIIQSGIVPTLAFYSDGSREEGKSGSEAAKKPVLDVLTLMLRTKDRYSDLEAGKLFEYALNIKANKSRLRLLQKDIVNASIALKLALRTFDLKD